MHATGMAAIQRLEGAHVPGRGAADQVGIGLNGFGRHGWQVGHGHGKGKAGAHLARFDAPGQRKV
jgi:hypothetical protein